MPTNMGGKSRRTPAGLDGGTTKKGKPFFAKGTAKKNPDTSAGEVTKNNASSGRKFNLPSGDRGYVRLPIRINGEVVPGLGGLKIQRGRGGAVQGADIDVEMSTLRVFFKKAGREKQAELNQPQKIEPTYAHFYLKEADGLKALTVAKVLIDYLAELGYGTVKILEVERGSLWSSFVAYWNSEGGEQARDVGKQKAKEGYQYAEQWAKDVTVNKQMAEVTATNVTNIGALLASVADQEDAILHVGNLLVIKNKGKVIAKDLTVPEMAALQKHSGILKDPATAVQMLALVVAGGSVPVHSEIEP